MASEYLSNKETNLENNKNHELGSFEQDPIRRDAIYYLEKGKSALIKRKNKLNEQITKAFKENKIYTEQARMDFKELHKINQHLFVKKELESTFGFDIVDFYTKYLKYGTDSNRRVDIKETMQGIEDSMKQEKNDEQTIPVMLTDSEKKELRELYDKIDHLHTTGKYSKIFSLIDTMNQKLNNYIEAGYLEHFKNYDFYNVDSSNTLTKLGFNKWDIKAFLTDSNKAEMNQGETETLEQEFFGKSMQELRKLKKELNSKITKDAKKGHTDTETFKENIRQLVDVRHNINIKSWIDDRMNKIKIFNVDKFCQKYSSRLGIDPKQQISMFYEDIAKDRRNLSRDEVSNLIDKQWDTVFLIKDMYQSLQNLEKNKDWSGVNEQTRAIMTELGNLFRTESQLELPHYYDVSDSHTLKKLNITDINQYFEEKNKLELNDQHDKPELKKLNITDVPQHFVEKFEQAKANKRIDGEKVPQETQQQQMNIEAKEQQESTAQVSFKNKKLESASLTFAEMLTKKAEEIRHSSRRKTSQKIQQQQMNTEVIYAEVKKEPKSKNADVSISLKAEEKLVDRLNKGKKERPEVPPKPMSKQRNLKELVLTQSPTQPSTLEFGEVEKLSIKDKIKLFEQKAVANRESRNSTTQELSR